MGDFRPPDFCTHLDNEYYSGTLEMYDDFIVVHGLYRGVEIRGEAWLDADDPALGYAFPLTLGPVEAGIEIEIPLPPLPDYDEERGPYRACVYFGVSGDEWVDRDVAYTVTHRFSGGEYETESVTGHYWNAPVTTEMLTTSLNSSLHSVVLYTVGFFAEGATEVTSVSKLYLVVGVLADDAPDFETTAERLRENPHEGTTVIFPEP